MQTQICSALDILAQPAYPSISPLPVLLVLHAIRASISWHQLRPTHDRPRSVLQDLCGFWVLAFGGSTLTAILLQQPLVWLTSPAVVVLYTTLYLFLRPILPIVLPLFPSTVLTIVLTVFDALHRSFSSLSIYTNLVAHTSGPFRSNPLAGPTLSAINVSGGRALVSLFGLASSEWTLQTPDMLAHGHLDPWLRLADVWSVVLGIGMLHWSAGSTEAPKTLGREEQAMCALTIAGCLAVTKSLASKRDGRPRPSPLSSSPVDRSSEDVAEKAESFSPIGSATDVPSPSEPSLKPSPLISNSSVWSSSSPSPSQTKSLSSGSGSSSSPVTLSTSLSPPPVIHRDFFEPREPLSAGRKKTIEIRNKELKRRAAELGDTIPSIVPHSSSSGPSSASSYSSSYSSSSPSSSAAVLSGVRLGKNSWDDEPTLRTRAFKSMSSGGTKIKGLLGRK